MVQLNANNRKGRAGGIVALVVTVVLSLALLTLWSNESRRDSGVLHTARVVVSTVAYPFQAVGSVLAMPFQAMTNGLTNAAADTGTLLELQQENAQLTAQTVELEELRAQNERLTQLLNMQNTLNLQSTGANVISRNSDSWNRTLVIDKGSSNGIEVGMPVTDGYGLIGQVESVTGSTATVRLITDEASGVSVMLQGSRAEGILTGSVDGLLYVEYIPMSVEVSLGEAVITSGMGATYPKGIVVGTVSRISGTSTDTYRTIVVEPLSEGDVNEEVLVLTGGETEVQPSEQGAAGTSDSDTVPGVIDPALTQPQQGDDAGLAATTGGE